MLTVVNVEDPSIGMKPFFPTILTTTTKNSCSTNVLTCQPLIYSTCLHAAQDSSISCVYTYWEWPKVLIGQSRTWWRGAEGYWRTCCCWKPWVMLRKEKIQSCYRILHSFDDQDMMEILTQDVVCVLWSIKNILPFGALCMAHPGGRGSSNGLETFCSLCC